VKILEAKAPENQPQRGERKGKGIFSLDVSALFRIETWNLICVCAYGIYVYKEVYRMRTNIVLQEDLVSEAFKYSKAKTKKDLIHEALKEYVEKHKRRDIRELRGKIQFEPDYDHKALRRER